jgi:23S rRNA pseudouridine2605 synthase
MYFALAFTVNRSPFTVHPKVPTQKLQKALAHAGLGSRRAMEEWIRSGRVYVNGKPAQIGARVQATDRITVDRKPLQTRTARSSPRIILYHKPQGEIVSRDDPENRPTVFADLPRLRNAKWLAVGRLDFMSSGLLIFTTSGELANRLTHPRFEVEREYAVRVRGQLDTRKKRMLLDGIDLEDGSARFDQVEDEGGEGANRWYRVVTREGRNRIVRRMFEALGLEVSRLIRVRFGDIRLPPRLRRGQIIELSRDEVMRLLTALNLQNQSKAAPVVA